MSERILDVQSLTLRFGGLTAVNQVNFQVKKGEIFAVIGPNGAGKTTVFNAITGVYQPTEGHVLFEGHPVRRPFTARVAAGFAAMGVFLSCCLVMAWNAQELWQAAIIDNYVYQQPFQWGQAVVSFFSKLREMPSSQTTYPALLGLCIGIAGNATTWQRTRRTPDLIAREGIARTFQNIRLFPEMTVTDNVLVGMHGKLRTRPWHAALRLPLFWREKREACAKAGEILKFAGLIEKCDTVADNLSYGHKRRLEIARALATDPRLVLLDEPAAGMNPAETADLMALIRKIRDRGISVLLIEHDMKLVMGVSDRIAVLDYGNKIAEGTPEQIQRDPKVIEAYLGAGNLMGAPMLQVEGIRTGYGPIEVLRGVSLRVEEGEIVTLIGANGSGKTSTLMCVSAIQPLRAGRILFQGEDIARSPAHALVGKGLAQVPEGRKIFSRLSVLENLEMGAYLRRDKDGIAADMERVYALFPVLRDRRKQLGGTLSGGEQQMLAIGRALMSRPKLLLMDEPSMGVAPLLIAKIFEAVRQLNQQGMTILLVEQNAHAALKLAQRGYVLEGGCIALEDTAANLLNDPRVREAYLGETV